MGWIENLPPVTFFGKGGEFSKSEDFGKFSLVMSKRDKEIGTFDKNAQEAWDSRE